MMLVQNSFKKGDKAFMILVYGYADQTSMVVECKVDKLSTEDRVKHFSTKETYRNRRNKVPQEKIEQMAPPKAKDPNEWYKRQFPNNEIYPKMAWVTYIHPMKGEISHWINTDSLKKNPNDFVQIIN